MTEYANFWILFSCSHVTHGRHLPESAGPECEKNLISHILQLQVTA